MSIIYEPKGKAREYCELAANLYRGCGHDCKYCYAPSATFKTRDQFRKASVRKEVIEKLRKEAPEYRGREVLLSFTCDPYQELNNKLNLTRQAIEIFISNEVHVNILTKGGSRSIGDFDLLSKNGSKYGTTLTFMSDGDSRHWEPEAALPHNRIDALLVAKTYGIETWVSLEPVISPTQTLQLIDETHECVDTYKVGKWNYHKDANLIDWHRFANEAIEKLEGYDKNYLIKNDLKAFINDRQTEQIQRGTTAEV